MATTETRFDVRSGDGATLAVWIDGEGPPLVLVHGSMQDHTANRTFVDALRDRVTTYSLDRRGFGASADTPEWSMEREFADVAAVVEAVAKRTGGPVALWGHSFGASAALGGAARSQFVSHLVLYEPSLGLRYPPGSIDAAEDALAAGDPDRAITEILAKVLEMSDDDIAAMRANPTWPTRRASAPTVPRECRAEEGWEWTPGQFGSIGAPALMLTGSDSPADLKATTEAAIAALDHPMVHVLDGHGHLAFRSDPAMVADVVVGFLRSHEL